MTTSILLSPQKQDLKYEPPSSPKNNFVKKTNRHLINPKKGKSLRWCFC